MATPKVGEKYRLKNTVGDESGGLHLPAGSVGTIELVVKKGEGKHGEDESGHPTGGVSIVFPSTTEGVNDRSWGIGLDEFDTYFEKEA